jgi:hypothetical protein
MDFKCGQVGCRWVTGMSFETIHGVDIGKSPHFLISFCLGQNGRRRDTGFAVITSDDGPRGYGQLRATITIDQGEFSGGIQSQYSALHGEHAGMKDVELLDFFH